MRKIPASPIVVFALLGLAVSALGVMAANWVSELCLGDFRAIAMLVVGCATAYLLAIVAYRSFLWLMPLQEGTISEGSAAEFRYNVHLLFHFFFFHPVIRSNILPVPAMRPFYLALGAKLGENTYSPGPIFDSPLTEIGDNTIIGHDAIIACHMVQGAKLILGRIRIGHNVTIGARAIVFADVVIGDGAIVGAGSVVHRGTRIGPGELWTGNPATRQAERAPTIARENAPSNSPDSSSS